jgi:hypothetical protein
LVRTNKEQNFNDGLFMDFVEQISIFPEDYAAAYLNIDQEKYS